MPSRKPRYHWLVLLLGWLLYGPLNAQQPTSVIGIDRPGSILFVGNSLTFYNNAIYTHLRGLLVAEDPANRKAIFLKSMTISGALLSDHRGGLMQLLDSRDWDVVVLQGQSREATDENKAQGFQTATRQFASHIRKRGAEPVLFMTWAYAERPEMIGNLAAAFLRLGHDVNARVIPVGLAFERVRKSIPGVSLHHSDGIHPSLEGTYLAAAVFYSSMFGKSPEGLDYHAGLDSHLARQLRQAAWQTWTDYQEVTTRD